MRPTTGVIVLAGGRGTRMGGVDKGSVTARGARLIDHVLAALPYGTPTAVVSPYPLGLPQVCESPLFGGPAAGIATGFHALDTPRVAVLSVDAPDSPRVLPRLVAALDAAPGASAAVATTGSRIQPLIALWNADALAAALAALGSPHNTSARRLLRAAPGALVRVPGTGAEVDYDTPAELCAWAARAST